MKRWSYNHDCCVVCETTEDRHVGYGQCYHCYHLEYNKERLRALKGTWKHQPRNYARWWAKFAARFGTNPHAKFVPESIVAVDVLNAQIPGYVLWKAVRAPLGDGKANEYHVDVLTQSGNVLERVPTRHVRVLKRAGLSGYRHVKRPPRADRTA